MTPRAFKRTALAAAAVGLLGLIAFFTGESDVRTPLSAASFWAVMLAWPTAFWSVIAATLASGVTSDQSPRVCRIGLTLVFLAALLLVMLILNTWGPAFDNLLSRAVTKLVVPVSILALSVAQAAWLLRARLPLRLQRIVVTLVAAVAFLVCGMIAADTGNRTLFGVLRVLLLADFAATLVAAAVHWLRRPRPTAVAVES